MTKEDLNPWIGMLLQSLYRIDYTYRHRNVNLFIDSGFIGDGHVLGDPGLLEVL